MSVVTRSMKKKMDEAALQEPSHINELPSEILEMILKQLDSGPKSLLPYRVVHPRWKGIIDDLLEKKSLKREFDVCPKSVIVQESDHESELTICCPAAVWNSKGNPFPSKSLFVGGTFNYAYWQERDGILYPKIEVGLDGFLSKFGLNLTCFTLDCVIIKSRSTIVKILSHLRNLKVLSVSNLRISDEAGMADSEPDNEPLPPLPNLSALELRSRTNALSYKHSQSSRIGSWFVDAYADQLESLVVKLPADHMEVEPLQKQGTTSTVDFQKLRELKVFHSNPKYFKLSCTPPLRRFSVVGIQADMTVDVNALCGQDEQHARTSYFGYYVESSGQQKFKGGSN